MGRLSVDWGHPWPKDGRQVLFCVVKVNTTLWLTFFQRWSEVWQSGGSSAKKGQKSPQTLSAICRMNGSLWDRKWEGGHCSQREEAVKVHSVCDGVVWRALWVRSVEEEEVVKGLRGWEGGQGAGGSHTQAMGLRPDWEHSKKSKNKAFNLKKLFYKGDFLLCCFIALRLVFLLDFEMLQLK